MAPIRSVQKRTMRGIMQELVGQHSTEVAIRIRDGMMSRNLRTAQKYLKWVAETTEGRPVETTRMVSLNEGPKGAYNLQKLPLTEQKKLLQLLRRAKDTTQASATP